jgi:hypothetical protein
VTGRGGHASERTRKWRRGEGKRKFGKGGGRKGFRYSKMRNRYRCKSQLEVIKLDLIIIINEY